MIDYLLLFLIVLGIHLTPALTPPTWPVIVVYTLGGMPLPVLAPVAASAAVIGRVSLALGCRRFAHRLPGRARSNLELARETIERRRGRGVLLIALFTFTPIPSAHLFEAAGVARLRLLPLASAYVVGRLGFYSAYALAAYQLRDVHFVEAFREHLTSPLAIAVQVALLVLLIALIRADWAKWLKR